MGHAAAQSRMTVHEGHEAPASTAAQVSQHVLGGEQFLQFPVVVTHGVSLFVSRQTHGKPLETPAYPGFHRPQWFAQVQGELAVG